MPPAIGLFITHTDVKAQHSCEQHLVDPCMREDFSLASYCPDGNVRDLLFQGRCTCTY